MWLVTRSARSTAMGEVGAVVLVCEDGLFGDELFLVDKSVHIIRIGTGTAVLV